jgi:L-lactate dehydrogenase complex protein LldG
MAKKTKYVEAFTTAAENVGSQVVSFSDIDQALEYVGQHGGGSVVVPTSPFSQRLALTKRLQQSGLSVITENFRETARNAASGITGVNFALADTGTLVLESTDEAIRLTTTLPKRHFALLDPRKILADGLAAVKPLRTMHQRDPRNYIAYITGPSRTADIERVLTIGVHGPKELHILLVPGISDDLMEM